MTVVQGLPMWLTDASLQTNPVGFYRKETYVRLLSYLISVRVHPINYPSALSAVVNRARDVQLKVGAMVSWTLVLRFRFWICPRRCSCIYTAA